MSNKSDKGGKDNKETIYASQACSRKIRESRSESAQNELTHGSRIKVKKYKTEKLLSSITANFVRRHESIESILTQSSRYPLIMSGQDLRLLALDGGGVRGLSSLMILERLMEAAKITRWRSFYLYLGFPNLTLLFLMVRMNSGY